MLRDHPRIAVVGTSGSGKTTFARSLASILGHEHVELDALHWGPDWTAKPEFPETVKAAVSAETWIVEGNYRRVRDLVWQRATAIVWLNYPFHVVFSRALARTVRRVFTRETLYSGNRESFLRSFFDPGGIPWWVIRTYHRRRREYPALLSQPCHQHLKLFELRSPSQAVALLNREAANLSPVAERVFSG